MKDAGPEVEDAAELGAEGVGQCELLIDLQGGGGCWRRSRASYGGVGLIFLYTQPRSTKSCEDNERANASCAGGIRFLQEIYS